MNIQKLKAATYAIYKRALGQELLKNPKGTSGTVVKTMEYFEYIDYETLDISKNYIITTKDFAKNKTSTTKETLFIDDYAFWNDKAKKIERKKHSNYVKRTDKTFLEKEKGAIPYEKLEKRDTSIYEKIVARRKDVYTDFSTAFLGYAGRKERIVDKTISEMVVEQYEKQRDRNIQKQFEKQGFWKTLIQNLKQ